MSTSRDQIEIKPRETLGDALKHKRLWVDTNQRSYAWVDKQIDDLYGDFRQVIDQGKDSEHFLGSIIVTRDQGGKPKVVDGQQRLATTMILLAAMRDYLDVNGDSERARIYEHQYLLTPDPDTLESVAHLNLNGLDNSFFLNRILLNPKDSKRATLSPTRPSHERILNASEKASQKVQEIVEGRIEDRADKLALWRKFIDERARVIWIEVPDDNAAFVIFETMNDRGLQLSAADLLKNLLFALAGDRMQEVQEKWFGMVGVLEAVFDAPEMLVTYIRHLWVSTREHVVLKNLYTSIKSSVRHKEDACNFADDLNANAQIYSALSNPSHEIWNKYPANVRKAVETLQLLSGDQIKPLLLSIVAKMPKEEVGKCLIMLVNWSVRFLISGGLGGGVVETRYGRAARSIRGKPAEGDALINTAVSLHDALYDIVASDVTFRTDFEKARSAKGDLARYYLRSIEMKLERRSDWQLLPRDEPQETNLEHVMPHNSRTQIVPAAWRHVSAEEAKAYYNRIGNLCLLVAKKNVVIGDKDFVLVKKPVFLQSTFQLTREVAGEEEWNAASIETRQKRLAELAIKTWPLKPRG